MADAQTESPKDPEPTDDAVVAEPAEGAADAAEPAEAGAPETESAAAASAEPTEAEPAAPEPAPAAAEPEPAPEAPAERVVYVTTPAPPRKRGNRVVGVLLTLLGVVLFAILFASVGALVIAVAAPESFAPTFGTLIQSWNFWVPVLVFLVFSVLSALLVNRGGWWAHVLLSLIVGLLVYFGQIGVFLFVGQFAAQFGITAKTFAEWAGDPFVILSAVAAREVSIWMGLAIAARGRRVKTRNVEARAAYERELAETRAEHERQAAAAG